MRDVLETLAQGEDLSPAQARDAFNEILQGNPSAAQMGAFLMGLRQKGATAEEIAAGAEVLRAQAVRIKAPDNTLDTCGTGGDGSGTLNISTAAAIVVAGCGVPVAKHGNRSVSSRCGSADVLEALGVRIDTDATVVERCIQECNIGFLLAPKFHSATKHVASARQELQMRTVFNLLGPLTNPARPQRQLLGVYAQRWVEPMAQVLRILGVKRAWVVHGEDGTDELTLGGMSHVASLEDGHISLHVLIPEEAGISRAPLSALQGGDAAHNARAIEALLMGRRNAYRDAVLLNAGAALVVAAKVRDIREGVQHAAQVIDDGVAYDTLQAWRACSHEALL